MDLVIGLLDSILDWLFDLIRVLLVDYLDLMCFFNIRYAYCFCFSFLIFCCQFKTEMAGAVELWRRLNLEIPAKVNRIKSEMQHKNLGAIETETMSSMLEDELAETAAPPPPPKWSDDEE